MADEKLPSLIKVDFGPISEVGKMLIQKVADGIGGLARPWQIGRVADAEAEAALTTARSEQDAKNIDMLAEIQRNELAQRAFYRFVASEMREQQNIESITQLALPQLTEEAQPGKIEDDWIANFFDKSRLISDTEMQTLWAKILAGEANTPGQYSKRTINLLSTLEKTEAVLFSKLCGFIWSVADKPTPIIIDFNSIIYRDQDINFESLMHLDNIGLIEFDGIGGFNTTNLSEQIRVSYFGAEATIKFRQQSNNGIRIGHALLTESGRELVSVCGASAVPGFKESVLAWWSNVGISIVIGEAGDGAGPSS